MQNANPFESREKIFEMICDATKSGEIQWSMRDNNLADYVCIAEYRGIGLWIANCGSQSHLSLKYKSKVAVAYRLYEDDCQKLLALVKLQVQTGRQPVESDILQHMQYGYLQEKVNQQALADERELVRNPSVMQDDNQPHRRFRFRLRDARE